MNATGDYPHLKQKNVCFINTWILNHESLLCFINEFKQYFALMMRFGDHGGRLCPLTS